MENIIVGWGLSGACMAWQHYFDQKKFQVYHVDMTKSSRVAAGIVNPVVFKRLNMSWKADVLLPFIDDFYPKIEKLLGVELLRKFSIHRVLTNIEEENNWSVKMADAPIDQWLSFSENAQVDPNDHFKIEFGLGSVHSTGHLKVNLFLDASKDFFEKEGVRFIPELFDYNTIDDNIDYFFCEGAAILNNPFFEAVKMRPTHGDILTIKTKVEVCTDVINRNIFILPIGNCEYIVGSTYNWKIETPIPTEDGKAELIEKLAKLVNFDYEIINQEAGLRPTLADRMPVLGTHSIRPNLHVLNGLGTKGVMVGPYCAAELYAAVYKGGTIDSTVDLKRFYK
ncbi:NAD(P)/FAD-dependent oxidoreductase [Crocinitomix catalasitica]|uniref:NAD(P)/FAD-dependent oxidoreductase n=1 Tax=Crocinitomix catalasitica TaxID=184607 RepID=UPI000489351C|nr:FAD-binding oxidoreductase [Crocinitomix catalasitica]